MPCTDKETSKEASESVAGLEPHVAVIEQLQQQQQLEHEPILMASTIPLNNVDIEADRFQETSIDVDRVQEQDCFVPWVPKPDCELSPISYACFGPGARFLAHTP